MVKLPKILIISLKLFNNLNLKIGGQYIDVDFIVDTSKYKNRSIIVHTGASAKSGHYFTVEEVDS